jgi:NADH dehydrogenase (ubiquinone) 1 alpha subcomplex subunit 13
VSECLIPPKNRLCTLRDVSNSSLPVLLLQQLDFGRYLPARGPKGWQLWAGSVTLIVYGFYQIGKTNKAAIQQKMQERKVRYALTPLLQAEADREYMERELLALLKEREIMKNVVDDTGRGWQAGASQYFGGQWMPRRIGHFMRHGS